MNLPIRCLPPRLPGWGAAILAAVLSLPPAAAQELQADDEQNDAARLVDQIGSDRLSWENSEGLARIVGGTAAAPGAWPGYAFVLIFDGQTKKLVSYCGGSIIDREWVLTAGHCIEPGRRYVILEGTNRARDEKMDWDGEAKQSVGAMLQFLTRKGTPIPVKEVIRHENFKNLCPGGCSVNDIALLRLAKPAHTPGQVLLGRDSRSAYLRPGKLTTGVGFGVLKESGEAFPSSLMQVDLPLVAQASCAGQHPQGQISDFNLCAGYDQGGKDTCQGDSGGPLYAPSPLGQQVQLGIVSWGPGCARPKGYGIYASVAYFQDWIRRRVPNARFVTEKAQRPNQAQPAATPAAATDQALTNYVGDTSAAPPSQLAQVNIDILPGARVKVGDRITVQVTSSISGNIVVYNQDSDGKTYQIFPNKFSARDLAEQDKAHITAGSAVTIPGPKDRFALRITPPTGLNRLIAVIVPPGVRIDDITQENEDMHSFEGVDGLLEEIAKREFEMREAKGIRVEHAAPKARAVAVRTYEIVP